MNNSFSIIVPAYKEEEFIESALTEIVLVFKNNNVDFEIITVVDTVPNDNTLEIIKKLSATFNEIKVIVREGKQGIASAIKEGIKHALKSVIIIAMGENSQNANDLLRMALKMNDGYDMVFGNRFLTGIRLERYPIKKHIANLLCNYAIRLLFDIKSRDVTNGVKAYKSAILKNMKIISSGFEIFAELPINAYLQGYKNFVDVPLNYYGRDNDFSKFDLIKEGPRYFKLVMHYLLHREWGNKLRITFLYIDIKR